MVQFCTIQDVADLLQVEVDEPSAARAITAATAAIKNYCRQQIEFIEDDEYTFDVREGQWNLILPEMPVVEVVSVVEDGETLVVNTDYKLANYGQLVRMSSGTSRARWKSGIQIVTVTYSHGYATIPDDVVDICTRAASRVYQAGLSAAENDGVLGVASKSLGDFSVSFSGEQGGGAGEGVMGVSAARMLLLSEKDILNKYRL